MLPRQESIDRVVELIKRGYDAHDRLFDRAMQKWVEEALEPKYVQPQLPFEHPTSEV